MMKPTIVTITKTANVRGDEISVVTRATRKLAETDKSSIAKFRNSDSGDPRSNI
jgi:hypothetical protein